MANSSGPIATYLRVACLLPKRSLCPAIPFLLPSWFRFEGSGFGVGPRVRGLGEREREREREREEERERP